MKNFDESRYQERSTRPASERTFVIGGQSFLLRSAVRPEVLARLDEVDMEAPGQVIAAVDSIIVDCLTEADREKWRQVRTTDDEATLISLQDLTELLQWVMGALSGRPTERPSDSSDGSAPTGMFSTVVSPSTEPTPSPMISAVS